MQQHAAGVISSAMLSAGGGTSRGTEGVPEAPVAPNNAGSARCQGRCLHPAPSGGAGKLTNKLQGEPAPARAARNHHCRKRYGEGPPGKKTWPRGSLGACVLGEEGTRGAGGCRAQVGGRGARCGAGHQPRCPGAPIGRVGGKKSTWGYWKDGGAVGTRVLHPLWIPGVNHGPQSRFQRPWGAAGGRQRGWHLSVPQGGGSWFPGERDGGCGVRMAVPPPGVSRHTQVTTGGQGSRHPAGLGARRGPSPAGWVALGGVAKTPARHRGAEERL